MATPILDIYMMKLNTTKEHLDIPLLLLKNHTTLDQNTTRNPSLISTLKESSMLVKRSTTELILSPTLMETLTAKMEMMASPPTLDPPSDSLDPATLSTPVQTLALNQAAITLLPLFAQLITSTIMQRESAM